MPLPAITATDVAVLEVHVISTSPLNFDDRIGNGAKVFLGSAELGAVTVNLGKLPTPAEYLQVYKEKGEPSAANVNTVPPF